MRMSFDAPEQRNRGLPDGSRMRCTRVDEHHALAVIKLDEPYGAHEPALTECLIEIAGVTQIRLAPSRRMIQVLFDGRFGTMRSVHRFLTTMGWRMRRHNPTNRSSHP